MGRADTVKILTALILSVCIVLCCTVQSFADSVYSDVAEEDPLMPVLELVTSEGVFEGSGGRFKAGQGFNRAMMSKVIQRLLKRQFKAPEEVLFEDVPEGVWYTDSSSVMVFLGLLNPKTDPCFHPDQLVTRQEFARFLYIFARYDGLTGYEPDEAVTLADADAISPGCMEAVGWTLSAGILRVDKEGFFHPGNTMTRGEAALAIYRFLKAEQ